MTEKNEHLELVQLLTDEGFENGWVLNGTELVIWEHEAEPPKPLKRPKA